MVEYKIRRGGADDAAVIARHRVEMFRDMGKVPSEALAGELLSASAEAIGALLKANTYLAWLAVDAEGRVLAGAGVEVKPQLPRVSEDRAGITRGALPLVVNVYTERAVRGQGIARALMSAVMEWAAAAGFDRVVLHASDAGRPLYESLGFAPTNEMRWTRTGGG